jgi:hypothetical protein
MHDDPPQFLRGWWLRGGDAESVATAAGGTTARTVREERTKAPSRRIRASAFHAGRRGAANQQLLTVNCGAQRTIRTAARPLYQP